MDIQTTTSILKSLTTNNVIYNPLLYKKILAYINYCILITPIVFTALNFLGFSYDFTQEEIIDLFKGFAIATPLFLGLINNVVLVITSKHLHILPWLSEAIDKSKI